MNDPHSLTPIFEPRSVGVVGASADPRKRGHQVVAALRQSGFEGPIHPVNPKGGEILGLSVVPSIAVLDEPPDLVYVATPAAIVPDVVRECGEAGVKGAIVPAVGFRESGPHGADLERRLLEAARTTGIRVVGPNTSGLLNTHIGLHMVGGEPLDPGGLAIVSQSGNVALDLMTSASRRPVGVSIYVGPGNETDVGFHEILDFLASHEPTRAIVVYMEGVQDGRALYDVVKRTVGRKPVVVLKGGRSAAGVSAARSHTGSLAGSFEVFRAAARQSGMIEVDASDELFAVGETLALQPVPDRLVASGAGFVVISDGGGHATLAADRFESLGVPIARISAETRDALERLFGPASSTINPIDAAGAPDAAPSVLVRAVEIAASDPACAGVLLIGLFGGYAIRFAASLADEENEAAVGLARAARAAGVPLVVHSLYEPRMPDPLVRLLGANVPVYGSLELAATCCAALWRAAMHHRRTVQVEAPGAATRGGAPAVAVGESTAEAAVSGRWLSEVEARELVAACGVTVVDGVFCESEDDLRSAAASLEGPWALKAVSTALPHKTEAGAVRLGIPDAEALLGAYRECLASTRAFLDRGNGPGQIDGVLLTRMMPPCVAQMLVGARRDDAFGPILTIGFGGLEAEVTPDVSIRLLPAGEDEVAEMIGELAGVALLTGYRGRPVADLDALIATALGVGRCLLENPELDEIELNPVFAYPDRAVALDASGRRV